MQSDQKARMQAEIVVLGYPIYEAEDYGKLTEVEAGMITRCAEAISAAQRVAIEECLEIVGGIENRIRALIVKEA